MMVNLVPSTLIVLSCRERKKRRVFMQRCIEKDQEPIEVPTGTLPRSQSLHFAAMAREDSKKDL